MELILFYQTRWKGGVLPEVLSPRSSLRNDNDWKSNIPAPVILDIPSPSYEVTTVTPQPKISSFPSLPDHKNVRREEVKQFLSVPIFAMQKNYKAILDDDEIPKKLHHTTFY